MKKNNKIKLKKGDEVIVLSGKDKGKNGKITKVNPSINKAIVTGINKVKRIKKQTKIKQEVLLKKKSQYIFLILHTMILSLKKALE